MSKKTVVIDGDALRKILAKKGRKLSEVSATIEMNENYVAACCSRNSMNLDAVERIEKRERIPREKYVVESAKYQQMELPLNQKCQTPTETVKKVDSEMLEVLKDIAASLRRISGRGE